MRSCKRDEKFLEKIGKPLQIKPKKTFLLRGMFQLLIVQDYETLFF